MSTTFSRLKEVTHLLDTAFGGRASLKKAAVFCVVAEYHKLGGIRQADIADAVGLPTTSVNQIVLSLTTQNIARRRARERGAGVVEYRLSPDDLRERLVILSPRGKLLASRVANILEKGNEAR